MNNPYLNMAIEEVNLAVEKLDKKCTDLYYEGMKNDLSYEEMDEHRKPYMDELHLALAAQTMMTPKENINSEKYDDLDRECQVPLNAFIEWCKCGMVTSYDGHGVYADKDKVYSWFYARPWDICHGYIRKDFEYVCWYNK